MRKSVNDKSFGIKEGLYTQNVGTFDLSHVVALYSENGRSELTTNVALS